MALLPLATCWQHQTCKKLFKSKLNSLLQAQSPSLGRRPHITIVDVELKERMSMRSRKSLLTVAISTNCFGITGLRYRFLYPTIPNLQYIAPSVSLFPSKKAIVSKPLILLFPWRISRFIELYVLPGLGILLQLFMALQPNVSVMTMKRSTSAVVQRDGHFEHGLHTQYGQAGRGYAMRQGIFVQRFNRDRVLPL